LGCSGSGTGIYSVCLDSYNFTPPITILICGVFRAETITFLPDEFSLSGLFLLEVNTLSTPELYSCFLEKIFNYPSISVFVCTFPYSITSFVS